MVGKDTEQQKLGFARGGCGRHPKTLGSTEGTEGTSQAGTRSNPLPAENPLGRVTVDTGTRTSTSKFHEHPQKRQWRPAPGKWL